MTKKFYVSMTWDNWPEGGSYGNVIEANSEEEAEALCRQEMAESRASESGVYDAAYYLEHYAHDWHVVDCHEEKTPEPAPTKTVWYGMIHDENGIYLFSSAVSKDNLLLVMSAHFDDITADEPIDVLRESGADWKYDFIEV